MTGGCTKQACAFRDDREKWRERNVEVVGISGDQPEGLALFKRAERLNFTLLADPDGKVAKAFGVPAGKGGSIDRFVKGEKFTLNRGVTTKRWTFLLAKDGKVLYKNDKVQAPMDSSTVLNFLKKKTLPRMPTILSGKEREDSSPWQRLDRSISRSAKKASPKTFFPKSSVYWKTTRSSNSSFLRKSQSDSNRSPNSRANSPSAS